MPSQTTESLGNPGRFNQAWLTCPDLDPAEFAIGEVASKRGLFGGSALRFGETQSHGVHGPTRLGCQSP